jgi:uncharacterized protein (TIGR03083 family)
MHEFPLSPERYWSLFASESASFLTAYSRAQLTERIPSCPSWSVVDLGRHLGGIYHRIADILEATSEINIVLAEDRIPKVDEGVAAWLVDGTARLMELLMITDPTAPLWTFNGPAPVAFWSRRLSHEAMVHTFDLEELHRPRHMPSVEYLADGIDEFFPVHLRRKLRGHPAEGLNGCLGINTTDSDDRWVLRLTPDSVTIEEATTPTDAELSGKAFDLLMFLWRRSDTASLKISGENAIVTAYQISVDLT